MPNASNISGTAIAPTISIGVCPIAPDDTLEAAIERADRALYESKSRGRNCFSLGLRKGGST